jgi:opacity protein-like surface antigen
MKKATLAAASMLVVATSLIPAEAADLAPAPDTSEWRFTLAPYVWGVGLSGDVGVFGKGPVDVDIPFSDILENLDFAAMGVAEAHNGTWGVFVDLNYTSLSADKSRSRALERDIFEQFSVEAQVSASADITEFIGTFMGQWRAVDSDQMTLDLMAGARYWNIDNDIEARASLTGQGPQNELTFSRAVSGSDGASWVDPMVGVKSRIDTDTAFYLTGWGMIGGFGIGSDFNWDVMGGVGYEWTDHFSTVLGYRALGVDYEDDGFVYDVIQQGVAVGAVINF